MSTRIQKAILLLCFFLVSTAAYGQVRVNEIGYAGVDFQGAAKWVELHNTGTADVDVSSFWLCNFPNYAQISTLTVLDGSTTIPPGGFVTVAFDGLGDADGEMGLYRDVEGNFGNFGSASFVLDYMQYGSAGHQREGVAVEAGVWDAGMFSAPAANGQTLAFLGGGSNSAENWGSSAPTPGALNTTDTANEGEAGFPSAFTIFGNYPEPFNPTTTIAFSLAEAAAVRVLVFDLLGRQMLSVPEQHFSAGANQTIPINASALASGIYLYQVRATTASSTTVRVGRMTLVK